MATEAQVQANRSNAQKSTGPRSAEGKAAVAQNAVKHGFAGRLDVIKGEEQAEFERHREVMLGELAPVGAVEAMLAERIAGLAWRLKRAERMQDEAFNALLTPDTSSLAVRIGQSFRPKRSEAEAETERELAFGRAVVKDFGHERVLDRLFMYERRMEHSLYRTMAELQRLRLMPEADGSAEPPVRSAAGTVGAGFKPARTASKETPDGVTTNAVASGSGAGPEGRGAGDQPAQDSELTGGRSAANESCKTKPISPSSGNGQITIGTGVTRVPVEEGAVKTKPIWPPTGTVGTDGPAELQTSDFKPQTPCESACSGT